MITEEKAINNFYINSFHETVVHIFILDSTHLMSCLLWMPGSVVDL